MEDTFNIASTLNAVHTSVLLSDVITSCKISCDSQGFNYDVTQLARLPASTVFFFFCRKTILKFDENFKLNLHQIKFWGSQ